MLLVMMTSRRESIVHNFGALNDVGRTAAETLVGPALGENQQLVIQVVNLDAPLADDVSKTLSDQLPEWCNVYAGLNNEQIAALEKAISRRLNLTRTAV